MEILEKLKKFKFYSVDEIKEIKSPLDFFKKVKNSLINSNSATIYTMYCGEGRMCKELINLCIERERKNKKTKIVCDKNQRSSKKLIDLVKKKNLKFFLFVDVSNTFDFFRLKEISAQFHSKLYVFDDEIIVTGANFDDFYFKNRLDRYFVIKNRQLGFDLINKNVEQIKQNFDYKDKINHLFTYDRLDERNVFNNLFNEEFDSVYISSAYFNLPSTYCEFLKRQKKLNFFVNDPKYNIFNNFGRFGGIISTLYKYSSYKTIKNIPNAKLYHFALNGYTMHKKGIWAFKGDICFTILGSSNFNRRSNERDEELNFCVITNDKEKVQMFKDEVNFLEKHSKVVNCKDFDFGKSKIFYIILFFLINKFL